MATPKKISGLSLKDRLAAAAQAGPPPVLDDESKELVKQLQGMGGFAALNVDPEELETPPEAPNVTDEEAFAELAATPTAHGAEAPIVITEQDEFESVPEGEEVTPGHLVDRGGHRVRPFIVTRDLAFLVCDFCGDKLPRDAFMAHVSETRNEKKEDKASTLYACTADHAEELAIGRRVERELEKTEADLEEADEELDQ